MCKVIPAIFIVENVDQIFIFNHSTFHLQSESTSYVYFLAGADHFGPMFMEYFVIYNKNVPAITLMWY